MAAPDVNGSGTREDLWTLKTPPGSSEYQMYRDKTLDPPALVCQVASTKLSYDLRCLVDLHAMLKTQEALGLAEVTQDARNNRMRAL